MSLYEYDTYIVTYNYVVKFICEPMYTSMFHNISNLQLSILLSCHCVIEKNNNSNNKM